VKAFTCDRYKFPLPEWHRFPLVKYERLRIRIEESGLIAPEDLIVPRAATDGELLLVHDADYLRRVAEGTLSRDEVRVMGLPWSQGLVERSRRSVAATIEACEWAMVDGVAAHLAGGTHHAFPARGAGFCVFNDAAVAARVLLAGGRARRVVIIDCDVHQGDGTASIFADDPAVFTFSIHGANNYPPVKPPSDLDIELDDGVKDEAYLEAVDRGVRTAIDRAGADLAIYLAGADPFLFDRLGRLGVSKEGLAARDRLVLGLCREAGLPVAVTLAGGYAEEIEDTVDIHYATVREAVAFADARTSPPDRPAGP